MPVIENVAQGTTSPFNVTISNNPYKVFCVWYFGSSTVGGADAHASYVRINGVGLTQWGSEYWDNYRSVELWYMKDANLPAPGTYSLTFAAVGGGNVCLGAVAFTAIYVNQANPFRSNVYVNSLTNNAPTVNGVPSMTGDLVVDGLFQVSSGVLTPSAGQTWVGGQVGMTNGHAGCSYRVGVSPSVNMVWSSTTANEWGIASVAITPCIDVRGRNVDYYVDVNDPDFQFRDAMGRIVPPHAIRSDTWGVILGINMPSSEVVTNFVQDKTGSYFYIEQVTYNDTNGQATIVCTRGDLDKVALARAAGQSTG